MIIGLHKAQQKNRNENNKKGASFLFFEFTLKTLLEVIR